MSGRLRARGLAPAEADELTARLIARLVTEGDPEEAAAFLDALVGDEPPPRCAARAPGAGSCADWVRRRRACSSARAAPVRHPTGRRPVRRGRTRDEYAVGRTDPPIVPARGPIRYGVMTRPPPRGPPGRGGRRPGCG